MEVVVDGTVAAEVASVIDVVQEEAGAFLRLGDPLAASAVQQGAHRRLFRHGINEGGIFCIAENGGGNKRCDSNAN